MIDYGGIVCSLAQLIMTGEGVCEVLMGSWKPRLVRCQAHFEGFLLPPLPPGAKAAEMMAAGDNGLTWRLWGMGVPPSILRTNTPLLARYAKTWRALLFAVLALRGILASGPVNPV